MMIVPKHTRRGPASPIVHLALDPRAGVPMYRQLYDGLRDAILSGRLARGARLPSSRALAADLGVSRNTVLQAFDQLRSEGYLAGRRGAGTRTRDVVPDALLTISRSAGAHGVPRARGKGARVVEASPRTAPVPAPDPPRISARGATLVASAARFPASPGRTPVPFELGVPAVDAFPMRLWSRLSSRRRRHGGVGLGESDPAGEPALRAAIADYLATARGARCTADNVLVLNGAQQGLHLVGQLLLDPGDAAWIEDPGYSGARLALEAGGARLTSIPVDAEGLDVAAGARLAPGARLAYVTPSHQFPLGSVMSAPRRVALLAWARRARAWIVEDDYDSEFRYGGRPLPCLQGLEAEHPDANGSAHVLYAGTFSKTLAAGLRLGYLVVPDALVDVFRAARSALDRHTPTLNQRVLADFIGEGHYARHIRRVRAVCAERQAVLIDAAAARLGGLLELAPHPAGLHLVGWLPPGIDDAAASEAAAASGVTAWPLSRYRFRPAARERGALLLGYAGYDEQAIRKGVDRLARALERERVRR